MKLALMITADARAVVVAAQQSEDALQGVGAQAGKTGAALQATARGSDGVNAGLREMERSGRAAGQGMAQAQAMGAGFLAGLRDQVATFGKSTEEMLRHRAAQLGVGQEASHLIIQLQNQRAAQTQAAQAAQAEAQAQREAAQAKQAQASAQASFLAGLRDQVAVQGLSTADTLRYRAAQLGVADGAESYIAALSASNNAHKMGAISAGQHAQALKYLPMQFTDVAVSIASGMPIWMVAIQQGGQIKDSFGGVGVAARETGRYVLGLLNPFTLTAAAMAVLAAGAYAGSQEARALQLAIIDSGNAAGVTQGQLMGMAAGVDAVVGTQGRAVEVLAALVATGQVGAAQLEAFTVAAVRLESVGGAAAEETAARFAELGKAPLQASLKLNESMNYLTASTYRQIKALMDQGRTTEAARVAQVAFADTLAERTSQMETNLGLVERGWRGIKSAVTEAWDAIKAIGRDAGPEGQLAVESDAITKLQAQIEQRKAAGFNTQLLDAELVKLRDRQSILQSDVRLRKSAAEAQAGQVKTAQQLAAWDQAGAQYASAQQQREAEIRKARVEGQALIAAGLLTEAALAQRIADINTKFATASAKGPANLAPENIAKAQLALDLSGIKAQSAELVSVYDDAEKVMQAMRSAGLIDESDYYASKLAFLNLNSEAQAAALEQEIERLEREKLIGKDRIDNERKVAEARAQLAKVKTNQAIGGIVLGIQEGSAQTSRTTEVDKFFAGAEKAADQRNANAVEGIRQSLMSQAQIEAEAHAARLTELTIYNASRLEGEALANGLIEEEKRRHANVMASIASQSDQMALSAASQATDQMYSLLKQAGMEQTALGKVAFLASKALAVAQIILSTNVAAAAALALPPVGLGPVAGLPLAGFIKAMGYASAGVTAGLAIAEASAEGGYDIPAGVNPVVQTHAKEMILPRAQADVIRDLAKTGGGGGEKSVITIVNNTSAKIGKVTERQLPNGERALILEEAVALVEARLGDPNSKTSRAMQRNFSVQRSR